MVAVDQPYTTDLRLQILTVTGSPTMIPVSALETDEHPGRKDETMATTISGMKGIEGMKAAREYWLGRLERAYEDKSERGQSSRLRIAEHISSINEAIAKMQAK